MEAIGPVTGSEALEARLLAPLRSVGWRFWTLVAVLLGVIALGIVAFTFQFREGLLVTGLRDRIFWGLYIAMFEFFLGVSMAGTFVSAVLRLAGARWRGPMTRAAETMSVSGLVAAFLFILLDVGHPDRLHHFLLFGRWESPLVWDVLGISTYLVGSWIYFFFGVIPDVALCRDRLATVIAGPRALFFRFASAGWVGMPRQARSLTRALGLMTILMVPVAVMMNAVASWIFSMTLREPWSNPMFGLYFVGGAAYSGIGLLVILMVILRRVYRLEEYVTPRHFVYLGYLLALFASVMIFFNVSDFVMAGYKMTPDSHFNLHQITQGDLAPIFWVYIWGGLVLPILIVLTPFTRTMTGIVLASVAANVGMFLERYVIVVAGLSVPLNPYRAATYAPTWVEWALTAAGVALFMLIVAGLLKLFPPLSIWEMKETLGLANGREKAFRAEDSSA